MEDEHRDHSPDPPPREENGAPTASPGRDEPLPYAHCISIEPSAPGNGADDEDFGFGTLIGADPSPSEAANNSPTECASAGLLLSGASNDKEEGEFNSLSWLGGRLGLGQETRRRRRRRVGSGEQRGLELPTHVDPDEEVRKVRQREQLDWQTRQQRRRTRPWTVCGVELAKGWTRAMEAMLPESMRTVHVEAGSQHWYITDRVLDVWGALRRPLAVTFYVLVAALLLWGLAALGIALLVPPPPEIPPSQRDVGGGLGVSARVDGAGVHMERPLAICGLLYDRREHAARRDKAWAHLYRDLLPPLASRLAKSGIQDSSSPGGGGARGEEIMLRSDVLVVDADTLKGVRTKVPDHQESKRWQALLESGAVWPTPSRRDARMFHEKTREWLDRECAVAGSERAQFIRDAKERGYMRLNVTGYIEPPPREPTPPPPPPPPRSSAAVPDDGDGGDEDVPKATEERPANAKRDRKAEFDSLFQLDEESSGGMKEEEESEWGRKATGADSRGGSHELASDAVGEGLGLAMLPVPEHLYRNVSIYDLHLVLFHFAAQAKDARAEWGRAPPGLASGIAREVLDGLSQYRSAMRITAPSRPPQGLDTTSFRYLLLALQSFVEGKVSEMYEGEGAVAMRSQALWSGAETGCVCPHHVGVPVPGAAWFEPADRERGEPAHVRVLFYPRLEPSSIDSVVTAVAATEAEPDPQGGVRPEGETDADSGWGGWLRSSVVAPLTDFIQRQRAQQVKGKEDRERRVEWELRDPVFVDEGAGDTGDKDVALRAALKVPGVRVRLAGSKEEGGRAASSPKYWVGGVSYDGWQRRYPITAAAYACIASCDLACGSGDH